MSRQGFDLELNRPERVNISVSHVCNLLCNFVHRKCFRPTFTTHHISCIMDAPRFPPYNLIIQHLAYGLGLSNEVKRATDSSKRWNFFFFSNLCMIREYYQGSRRLGSLGKREARLMLFSFRKSMSTRSRPMPPPPWGGHPIRNPSI